VPEPAPEIKELLDALRKAKQSTKNLSKEVEKQT